MSLKKLLSYRTHPSVVEFKQVFMEWIAVTLFGIGCVFILASFTIGVSLKTLPALLSVSSLFVAVLLGVLILYLLYGNKDS